MACMDSVFEAPALLLWFYSNNSYRYINILFLVPLWGKLQSRAPSANNNFPNGGRLRAVTGEHRSCYVDDLI